jgi:hypothetical protein
MMVNGSSSGSMGKSVIDGRGCPLRGKEVSNSFSLTDVDKIISRMTASSKGIRSQDFIIVSF